MPWKKPYFRLELTHSVNFKDEIMRMFHKIVIAGFSAGLLLSSGIVSANTFIFNPNTHSWKAINDNGKVVRSGRASGGKKYCPDIKRGCKTPSGTFSVQSKGGPGCKSSRYPVGKGGAPMPYCMFFSQYYAVHGSPDVPGYNASHGCVRVPTSDARWLSNNFMRVGTTVIVKPY